MIYIFNRMDFFEPFRCFGFWRLELTLVLLYAATVTNEKYKFSLEASTIHAFKSAKPHRRLLRLSKNV